MNGRETKKIVLCLGATSLLAALILGITFFLTEPTRQENLREREQATIRNLLNLGAEEAVTEVRRYLQTSPEMRFGYGFGNRIYWYDSSGQAQGTGPVADGSQTLGRFFVACDLQKQPTGYVAEASQFGFKSNIRFFVALSPDFTVKGIEVLSHEEDPGLGAEITKPAFKNKLVGKSLEALALIEVVREPVSPDMQNKIQAVTGATISSRALVAGVQKTAAHLQKRLTQVLKGREICHE